MVRFDPLSQAMERQRGAKPNCRVIRRDVHAELLDVHACQFGLTFLICQTKLTWQIATPEQVKDLRGARSAGAPPRPCAEPIRVQQRASNTGVIMVPGHSAIALTMNTYSHVAPEVSREAAERMARMLWLDVGEDRVADEES